MKLFIYMAAAMVLIRALMIIEYYRDKTIDLELQKKLYRKCAGAVMDYLNKNATASFSEIKDFISGLSTSVFWCNKKLGVDKPEAFTETVISNLLKQGYISESVDNSVKLYSLK